MPDLKTRILAALLTLYVEDDGDAHAVAETADCSADDVRDLMRDLNVTTPAPLDLSGGDPGYRLIAKGGPVTLTLETPNGIERKASFATIADAESYLGISRTIDPVDLHEGRYGIDAPHGAGSDDEAVRYARARGFQLFWSMGAACWAPPGVAISGNVSGKGWRTGFLSIEAAAHAALASVDPD